jgi:hypothetical protein
VRALVAASRAARTTHHRYWKQSQAPAFCGPPCPRKIANAVARGESTRGGVISPGIGQPDPCGHLDGTAPRGPLTTTSPARPPGRHQKDSPLMTCLACHWTHTSFERAPAVRQAHRPGRLEVHRQLHPRRARRCLHDPHGRQLPRVVALRSHPRFTRQIWRTRFHGRRALHCPPRSVHRITWFKIDEVGPAHCIRAR